jgi:nitrite reductase/ring-hydroxylating ferredoxin subunit
MSDSVFEREDVVEYRKLLPDEYAEQFDATDATFEVGPIEPDPEALVDKSRRSVVRKQQMAGGKRFPFPIPNGWFVVGESSKLGPGEVQSLYAFGRDVVLYRSEEGTPRLIDAYCPHLGAHIGAGGKVDGDGIRCPFHGWRYEGASGRCTDIPYTEDDRIPAGGQVRSYPLVERNHMIWAWHHLEEEPPAFEVPEVPELSDPDWLPYEVKTFEIATCIQEMAENDADLAHFKYVHGSLAMPEGEMTVDGHYRRSSNGTFIRESFGIGCTVLHIADVFRFVSSAVPIDEENVRVIWWFTAPRASGEGAAKVIAEAFFTGVSQDLAIWENKRYLPKPLLTESEKKIVEQRKWASQFYSGYEP